jgi:preprotein translocase subunit YajC
MDLNNSAVFLLAQAAPAGQPPGWTQLVLFAPVILIMVVMFMSQSKKGKQHAEMLKTLKPGDRVMTSSGILGTVITVKEQSLTLRSADAKLELAKSAVAEIKERGTDKPETKSET